MNGDRAIASFFRIYVCVVFCFVFAPIIASFTFSFNSDRFPTIPLGHFTFHWYETIYNDPDTWDALWLSVTSAVSVSLIATFIGFCTAYTDYRYRFFGKTAYLALALLPPTIPLVIMGLAMLAWLSRIGMSGQLYSIIIAHVVLCTPFAMAIIRLRLAQLDPSVEAAAWNLGASEWRTMREVIIPFATPAILSALCLTVPVTLRRPGRLSNERSHRCWVDVGRDRRPTRPTYGGPPRAPDPCPPCGLMRRRPSPPEPPAVAARMVGQRPVSLPCG